MASRSDDQLLHFGRHQKFAEPFEIERADFLQRMFAVEMLNDKKIVEREDEFFLAEPARVPEDHVLLLTLFDGGKLEIPQERILFGIFGRACSWSLVERRRWHSNEPVSCPATGSQGACVIGSACLGRLIPLL